MMTTKREELKMSQATLDYIMAQMAELQAAIQSTDDMHEAYALETARNALDHVLQWAVVIE